MAVNDIKDRIQNGKPQTKRDIAQLPKEKQLPAMLDSFKNEINRALPRHLNADRMCRIALTEFRKNRDLAKCEPASVFAAIITASQLGLEPGLMGQAYLIPYKDQCQMIPGYQGLIDLVRRSGKVKRIEAHVVHENDKFEYVTGLSTELSHTPCLDGDPGEPRLAYAVAEFVDGGFHVEVMTRRQIESIRDRSNAVKSAKRFGKTTPWDTDTEEMWRKTLVRRICKYLPKSAELAAAVALDDAANDGGQGLNIDDAIDGTWAPAEETETEERKDPPWEDAKPADTGYSNAAMDWMAAMDDITDFGAALKQIRNDPHLTEAEKADLIDELRVRQGKA